MSQTFLYGELDSDTVITSESLELVSEEEHNVFKFFDDVVVNGTNLEVYCDELCVYALKKQDEESNSLGEMGAIDKIIADGDVTMEQEERTIRAGHAEIFPVEGKVVLTENPEISDSRGTVTGYEMTIYKGERMARIKGGPDGTRPSVTLPSLPDLGFSNEENKDEAQQQREERISHMNEEDRVAPQEARGSNYYYTSNHSNIPRH